MSSPSSAPWAMPERPRRWTPTAICGPAPRTEHAMPRQVSCWNRRANTGPHLVPQASDLRKYARSHVEAELHDVTIGHDVVLAFDPDLAGGLRRSYGARRDQIIEGDDLSLDEPTLEVGVDHAGRLGRRPALVDRPGPRLLVSGGQERLEAETGKAHSRKLIHARLLHTDRRQELDRVLGLQLGQVHLQLGVEIDRIDRGDQRGQFRLQGVVGQLVLVEVEHIEEW